MEEGKGPGLPIRADVPERMTGLGGQTGAPLALCRYRQLLYITGEKTTHFISLPLSRSLLPSLLPLSFIPLALLYRHSLFFSIFSSTQTGVHTRTHTYARTRRHTSSIFLRHPHPIHPLKETHFSFADSSKSLFTPR